MFPCRAACCGLRRGGLVTTRRSRGPAPRTSTGSRSLDLLAGAICGRCARWTRRSSRSWWSQRTPVALATTIADDGATRGRRNLVEGVADTVWTSAHTASRETLDLLWVGHWWSTLTFWDQWKVFATWHLLRQRQSLVTGWGRYMTSMADLARIYADLYTEDGSVVRRWW
jgi:hypothetical protein